MGATRVDDAWENHVRRLTYTYDRATGPSPSAASKGGSIARAAS
jgi:hypothetical protein